MRVSELYGLSGTQGTFEFIDVDVERDTPLFIDPAVIASIGSPWTSACGAAIQGFFQAVLDEIVAGNASNAKNLLSYLGEENATHLGYSRHSRGSGVGVGLAERFYNELAGSSAVASGLITDIEDTALLVEGVREDRISDVVTNIIRNRLAEFTQMTALFHGIPLEKNVAIGPYWDTARASWMVQPFDLPVTARGPLLLVPKSIVRRSLFINPDVYYRYFVLEYFRQKELRRPHSPLVYVIKKTGERHVTKKSVEEKYRERYAGRPGVEKRINTAATEDDPGLIRRYKDDLRRNPPTPIDHDEVAEWTGAPAPDLDALLAAVLAVKPGTEEATAYERAVEALLTALFYPELSNPVRQERIHDGRKRIDISYVNTGHRRNFFGWLANNMPAANVVVECKNYSRPIANPEYDQIAGRFSPSRGRFGLLVYRTYEDFDKMIESCRDTAHDDRGVIVPLSDEDLAALVDEAKRGSCFAFGGLLHERYKSVID